MTRRVVLPSPAGVPGLALEIRDVHQSWGLAQALLHFLSNTPRGVRFSTPLQASEGAVEGRTPAKSSRALNKTAIFGTPENSRIGPRRADWAGVFTPAGPLPAWCWTAFSEALEEFYPF